MPGEQLYLGDTLIYSESSFLGTTQVSFNNSPSIVTNNLLFYVNAGDVASYSGTGTTWYDLSGQTNTATLVNTPTFTSAGTGSYFTFSNASNSYATTANTTSFGTNATFIAFINSAATQAGFNGILFSRTGGVANGMNTFDGVANALGYTWENTQYQWYSGLIIPNNEWCMVAITITSTAAKAYLYKASGITTSTNTVGHGSGGNINLNVAWDPFSATRSFDGRLNIAMCYNAALTQAQLDQNWNVLKNQVGL
jgi:hypothetical protein